MRPEPAANILLVDDDPRTLNALEALLMGPGRAIVKAGSGQAALRCLLRQEFALILLDVRMPEMDGFETAALVRQRERSRYTPIIFLSAVDTHVFRDVSNTGAVDYLFKPVVPEVLQAKVSAFVDLFHVHERLKRQAIRQSEERFRLLVEGIRDYAILILDRAGRVSSWNIGAERITGYRAEEIVGRSIACFFTAVDRADDVPGLALRRAAEEGRAEFEGWRVRKDGSLLWANAVVTALRDDQGDLVGFSEVTRDLTERRRMDQELHRLNAELESRVMERTSDLVKAVDERNRLQEQLWQAQKMESIGTLATGIAHNFNNILGVVLGHVSQLPRPDGTDSTGLSEGIAAIRSATDRGRLLVHQLLTFARKTDVVVEKIDINAEVEETVKMLAQILPQGISVSLDLAPELGDIPADRNQLHQALLNVCINARDAMPEGGSLFLETRMVSGAGVRAKFSDAQGEEYACICVRDTGTGMDADVKRRLFEPFFTTKDVGQGTGLGLAVTYGIMTGHAGHVGVESEVGRGSAISLYFPLDPLPVEPAKA